MQNFCWATSRLILSSFLQHFSRLPAINWASGCCGILLPQERRFANYVAATSGQRCQLRSTRGLNKIRASIAKNLAIFSISSSQWQCIIPANAYLLGFTLGKYRLKFGTQARHREARIPVKGPPTTYIMPFAHLRGHLNWVTSVLLSDSDHWGTAGETLSIKSPRHTGRKPV